jgi:dCMP deaminase
MNLDKWDERFFSRVDVLASFSKDESTKVGCVFTKDKRIVVEGYNGLPDYLDDNDDFYQNRPQKYHFFEHAERNAIQTAHRHLLSLDGTTCYVNWLPCCDCTRAILSQGVKMIKCDISFNKLRPDMNEVFKHSALMIEKSGAELLVTNDRLTFKNLFHYL